MEFASITTRPCGSHPSTRTPSFGSTATAANCSESTCPAVALLPECRDLARTAPATPIVCPHRRGRGRNSWCGLSLSVAGTPPEAAISKAGTIRNNRSNIAIVLIVGAGKHRQGRGRQGNSMETALLVKDLRSAFAGPFELNLGTGACAAITGPSGSGKSLFLRMIADLDPNEGKVWLNGRERASIPAPQWRRQATYVSAESGWWADRVIEHFDVNRRNKVAALAARLGLRADLLDAPVAQLSTGEKQRLSLIRALLPSPPVLLLDEPTGPLDEESVVQVEALLQERMTTGTSILLVTHDPNQAERLGDQHYRMVAGHLQTP